VVADRRGDVRTAAVVPAAAEANEIKSKIGDEFYAAESSQQGEKVPEEG
jgi:hypothetical protein